MQKIYFDKIYNFGNIQLYGASNEDPDKMNLIDLVRTFNEYFELDKNNINICIVDIDYIDLDSIRDARDNHNISPYSKWDITRGDLVLGTYIFLRSDSLNNVFICPYNKIDNE